MDLKVKTEKQEYPVFGFSMSVLLHAIIITAAALILSSTIDESKVGSAYVQLSTIESPSESQSLEPAESKIIEKHEVTEKAEEVKNIAPEETKKFTEKVSEPAPNEAVFYDFSNTRADTAGLVQIYKENTLDVTLKYPAGWTYLDQNVKNTLDGVTFWTTSTKYNPPPYVHIEVKDKDLFNPNRFQHNYKTRNYTAYYNEPEKLSGQITQIIYIRTNTEYDFSLKLIMKGEEAFKSFQPVFFGMVKSFKYGNQFF
jgi:hypothetical protein